MIDYIVYRTVIAFPWILLCVYLFVSFCTTEYFKYRRG